MDSLNPVRDLLSHRKRQDLAELLTCARIDFEYVDTGFSLQNESVTALVNAVVYAPISTYDQLLALLDEDEGMIWDAIADVWPNVEGDQAIVRRKVRLDTAPHESADVNREFLDREFEIPNLRDLPITNEVSKIVQDRLDEAQLCLSTGAYLSVIFLCGSLLEAVLLGAAQNEPKRFHLSRASPRRDGKVKRFNEWSLSEFIDVAHDIGLLGPDVKGLSHELRNFRNYIHPHKQMESGFKPDEYTATICFQVLKAALASVSGSRQ